MKKYKSILLSLVLIVGLILTPIKAEAISKGLVKDISIVKPNKLQISLEEADPTDKTLTLCGQNKTSFTARYDKMSNSFLIQDGYLELGTNYKVLADWVKVPAQIENVAIPVVKTVKQISPNQIQITFDRDVELSQATNPKNYWLRDTNAMLPSGVASIGKIGKPTDKNTLTTEMVKITSIGNSKKHFNFTFSKNIFKNVDYKLQVCNISADGFSGYLGDNYDKNTNNLFKGQ